MMSYCIKKVPMDTKTLPSMVGATTFIALFPKLTLHYWAGKHFESILHSVSLCTIAWVKRRKHNVLEHKTWWDP